MNNLVLFEEKKSGRKVSNKNNFKELPESLRRLDDG